MKMNNEKKKEVLLKNFEIIDKNFAENGKSLSQIVIKMFALDSETAFNMWEHLIKKYESELNGWFSGYLTEDIYMDGSNSIGYGKMDSTILNSPNLKKAIFSLTSRVDRPATFIIEHTIEKNELTLANELMQLLYENYNKDMNWYKIMDRILTYTDKNISNEAYELLEIWCDKVESEEEKAKLSIKMLDYIE